MSAFHVLLTITCFTGLRSLVALGIHANVLREGKHTARVWQASHVTAHGAWCWSIDNRCTHVTRGNRGVAKAAAKRALTRASLLVHEPDKHA